MVNFGYVPFPEEYLPWTIVILVIASVLTMGFLYLMGWNTQRNEDLDRKLALLKAGKTPDELDAMKTDTWNHTYTAAMVLGSVLAVGVAYGLMTLIVPSNFTCVTYGQYIFFSIGCAILSAFVVDYFCHKLADGWLDKRVYRPLVADKIDAIVQQWLEKKTAEEEAKAKADAKAEADKLNAEKFAELQAIVEKMTGKKLDESGNIRDLQ